jgi:SAM-dependent methyltransferase
MEEDLFVSDSFHSQRGYQNIMKLNTITYDPIKEEEARSGWYLGPRDKFVLKIIKKYTDFNLSKRILDAGCGTGGVISGFKNTETLIAGTDTSLESIVLGKKRNSIINGIQASVTNLPFRDKIFDISISTEVLEHVDDDLSALKELCRVTKNRIIITVPAHNYLWTDSDDILLHKRRYSRSKLLKLFQTSGVKPIILKPYGLVLGLLIISYKLFDSTKSKTDKKDTKDLPLGARFKISKTVENILKNIFLFDLWFSSKGLLPWGHSWWACVEITKNQQQ